MDLNPAFDDASGFVRREFGLLLPTAFATFGVGILILVMVMKIDATGRPVEGPWMWWLIPTMVLVSIGRLAVCALKLFPGISVAEAFQMALRRLPQALLFQLVVFVGVVVVTTLIAALLMMIGRPPQLASMIALLILIPFLVYGAARLVAVEPALMAAPAPGLLRWVGDAWRLSQGYAARLLLIVLAGVFAYFILMSVLALVAGLIFRMLALATGQTDTIRALASLTYSLCFAAFFVAWQVLITAIYQRLASGRDGQTSAI